MKPRVLGSPLEGSGPAFEVVRGETIQVVKFERSASFNVAVAGRGAGRSADLAEGGGRLPGGSRPSGEPGAVQPRRVGLPRKGTNKCRVAVAGPTRIGEVDGGQRLHVRSRLCWLQPLRSALSKRSRLQLPHGDHAPRAC